MVTRVVLQYEGRYLGLIGKRLRFMPDFFPEEVMFSPKASVALDKITFKITSSFHSYLLRYTLNKTSKIPRI